MEKGEREYERKPEKKQGKKSLDGWMNGEIERGTLNGLPLDRQYTALLT